MGLKVLRIKNENVNSVVRKIKKYPIIKDYKTKLKRIITKVDGL